MSSSTTEETARVIFTAAVVTVSDSCARAWQPDRQHHYAFRRTLRRCGRSCRNFRRGRSKRQSWRLRFRLSSVRKLLISQLGNCRD